ncbi:AMED_5909 family protein [Saccharothrix algeriensis]|uniref:Uncharacterized protein n=1 Tax=Saccharothrix algeriensis TaxID=173560 RepID=A0ABS2S451_9PSEU|nr:AMED_5909 family protein [Saccharothrix algeriensis]MBM7811006.1 hypothetical protein [Saccharothrix algeriensis]
MAKSKPDLWALALASRTLKDAHEALGRLVPAPDAAPLVFREFYLRSARVYERIAEVDRHHHHEALYWVTRERALAEAIEADDECGGSVPERMGGEG